MPYTLVIVDMQGRFQSANCEETQAECIMHIRQAIDNDAAIVVVKFRHYDPVVPNLVGEYQDYDKIHTVVKFQNDGSLEVHECVEKWDLSPNFRVCGVNLGACVESTVMGLVELGYDDIVLLERACNQPDHWDWAGPLDNMAEAGVAVLSCPS